MSAEIIPFVRYKKCNGIPYPKLKQWFKENGWTNVRFHVRDLDVLIAERLPR